MTKEIHERFRCKMESPNHSQIREGGFINGSILPTKSGLICKECGKEIFNVKSIRKRFCDDCLKKHRYLKVRRWKAKHPDKEREYNERRHLKKVHAQGKFSRSEIFNCPMCEKDISSSPHRLYCVDCNKKREKIRCKKKDRKRLYRNHFHRFVKYSFTIFDNITTPVFQRIYNEKKNITILSNKLLIKLINLTFGKFEYKICQDCGNILFNSSSHRKFCGTCLKNHKNEYYEKNREKYLAYNRHYNIFRRLGTGSLGSHRDLNFKSELKKVHYEKQQTFKYGNTSARFTGLGLKKRDSFEKSILGTRSEFEL